MKFFLYIHSFTFDNYFSLIKSDNDNDNNELRKSLLVEITDEELESLECPTIQKQIDDLNHLMSLLTESKIKAFIESLKYEMISMKHHTESNGIINNIIFIECKEKHHPFNEKKFVLKISNPFKAWKKLKTRHEAVITKYLKQNTTIPVPDIIAYSCDSETSPLNCEFILMEFLEGKILQEVISKNVDELPQTIIDQFVDILKQLKSLQINQNKIGRFDENMNIVPNGPDWIVSDNFLECFEYSMKYLIKELRKFNKYRHIADDYEDFLNKLIKIVNENPSLDKLNFNDKMSICHNDLNPSNILVDEKTYKITGILDWEWSGIGFDDDQLDFFKHCYSDKEKRLTIKTEMKDVYAQNFEKMNGKDYRNELEKILDALYFATYFLPSFLTHSTSSSNKTDDVNLNIRLRIDDFVKKAEENLNKTSNILKILAEYKI